MNRSATLLLLGLLAACGRTQPLRYVGEDGSPIFAPPDGTRDCPRDVQTFTLPAVPNPAVDVLLVVDDSGSMGDDQEVLASNFGAFISRFRSENVDFHLGVVTTDMEAPNRSGRLVAPFLTPVTPNLEQAFRSMVLLGSNGSSDERGLDAAHGALSDPLASGPNQGFLRPKTDLAVVVLTDETDHSRISPAQFSAFLGSLEAPPESTSFVAILGLTWYFLCERMTASWGYAEVARSLGPNGMVVACTSDYASRMTEMGGRIVNARCVVDLQHPVDRGPPQVRLNGSPVSYVLWPPDGAHPNGTLEIDPCPRNGGEVEVIEPNCP